jgi:hypothetical protein
VGIEAKGVEAWLGMAVEEDDGKGNKWLRKGHSLRISDVVNVEVTTGAK